MSYDPEIICNDNPKIDRMSRKYVSWIPWIGVIIGVIIAIVWFSDAFAEGGEFAVILIPTILLVSAIPIVLGVVIYLILYLSRKRKITNDCYENPQNYGVNIAEEKEETQKERRRWNLFRSVSRSF